MEMRYKYESYSRSVYSGCSHISLKSITRQGSDAHLTKVIKAAPQLVARRSDFRRHSRIRLGMCLS